MHHDHDRHDNLGFAAGDRVKLAVTSDPFTRLRPGDRGAVTSIGHLPGDPPEVQVRIAWDSGSTLAMLPAAGDQLRKRTDDHDPPTQSPPTTTPPLRLRGPTAPR
jgi:hypothetical protein